MQLSASASLILAALEARDPSPPLAPTSSWRSDLASELDAAADDDMLAGAVANSWMARAVRSGLLLWNDALDPAHTLAMSEDVDDDLSRQTLDYWHGIMHRREPDYPNSKYWFRRVGNHPTFGAVLTAAKATIDVSTAPASDPARQLVAAADHWDPFAFIDLCEEHERSAGKTNELLRAVQVAEIGALLDFSARHAVGAAVEL
jgi:hypothetical protein